MNDMNPTIRALFGVLLAAATLAIPAVVILVIATATPSLASPVTDEHRPGLAACHYEDGSGQARCVWDAGRMGNGVGHSFVAFRGGTDDARYVYVSNRVARQLVAR